MMRRIAAVAVVLLACACGSPAPRIDYYSLTSPSAPSAPTAPPSKLVIHIGPVTVPDAVDRPQMVVRRAESLDIDDQHRWVEPLKNAIPRLLADSIALELNTPNVLTSRQSSALDMDYRVAIDVQHFDSSPGGVSEDVLWTIRSRKDTTPRLGRSIVREDAGSGADGIATAHSRALARVAHDIAQAIQSMEAIRSAESK